MSKPITSDEIRESFLKFFESKGHLRVASASLIPIGDPTLLLTIAGMNQFKPYFSGLEIPSNKRLTSAQKCFRTPDIDIVGDSTHNTMFEMLGNFSIGDYFKKEVISYALEFLTKKLELPIEKFSITVHHTDDEAHDLWINSGISPNKIYRFGDEDNWWGPPIHGEEGPCGPCSELHYDFGDTKGCLEINCAPNCENKMSSGEKCTRYVELWNLVFMQFYHHSSGNRDNLPAPSIDTGMGLERATMIMQNSETMYETDIFQYLIHMVSKISKVEYGKNLDTDYAIRGIAEHMRSSTFLIADGVVPGNEGRGYVLRRVIRRAIRLAKKLSIESSFTYDLASAVIDKMGLVYPELVNHKEFVTTALKSEEEKFKHAFENGFQILQETLKDTTLLSGSVVFKLWDTYGFPIEMTNEIAQENNVTIDIDGFNLAMESQKNRARSASQFKNNDNKLKNYDNLGIGQTKFTGYDTLKSETVIVGLLIDEKPVNEVFEAQNVEIILQETPFYAEGGGQIGDSGTINGTYSIFKVKDTKEVIPNITGHFGTLEKGKLTIGDKVTCHVDPIKRIDTARNHTATHMLHAALREILGPHVRQAGSLVTPDRFRFDFSHVKPITEKEMWDIQHLVNEKIRQNAQINKDEDSYSEAIRRGALAFFGDKYGETVRLIEIVNGETFSFEVCGGTHVSKTGELGSMLVISESSIGSGMRRIEAVSGRAAETLIWSKVLKESRISKALQTSSNDIEKKVAAMIEQLEVSDKEKAALESKLAIQSAKSLLSNITYVNGVKVLSVKIEVSSSDLLRSTGDWLKSKINTGVIALGSIINGNPTLIVMVSKDLVAKGLDASLLVKNSAKVMGGGGGGKPEIAQAGGKIPEKLEEALELISAYVQSSLVKK
jgi:alanyl-tRNA synthetase